jgi:hypothetical protein
MWGTSSHSDELTGDFGNEPERLEAARRQRRLKVIRKGHVLAGVGDEHPGLWRTAAIGGLDLLGHDIDPG